MNLYSWKGTKQRADAFKDQEDNSYYNVNSVFSAWLDRDL